VALTASTPFGERSTGACTQRWAFGRKVHAAARRAGMVDRQSIWRQVVHESRPRSRCALALEYEFLGVGGTDTGSPLNLVESLGTTSRPPPAPDQSPSSSIGRWPREGVIKVPLRAQRACSGSCATVSANLGESFLVGKSYPPRRSGREALSNRCGWWHRQGTDAGRVLGEPRSPAPSATAQGRCVAVTVRRRHRAGLGWVTSRRGSAGE